MGNWLSVPAGAGAAERAGCRHEEGPARPRDPGSAPGLRPAAVGGGGAHLPAHPAAGRPMVHRGPRRQAWARPDGSDADLGQGGERCVGRGRRRHRWPRVPRGGSRRPSAAVGLSEKVVWQLLQQYAAAMGAPGIAPHDLRRYAESRIMPNRWLDLRFGGQFRSSRARAIRHYRGGATGSSGRPVIRRPADTGPL